jgi:ATP-dependent helicase HrpA
MDRSKPASAQAAALLRRIHALGAEAMLRDRAGVDRRLEQLRRRAERAGDAGPILGELAALAGRLEKSAAEGKARRDRRPAVRYPAELPITPLRTEIVRAIRTHPVVIISGETGCGKSTQIPKMCLEAGRGILGRIACTQPRRIAAVTIAHRIAQELGEPIGHSVGYKIRFQDRTSPEAYIKVMTDGMLLAETRSDPALSEYDTLLIDEAHERSLNIDFLLGISRTLLARRGELKLIITSATLDTAKFSAAFGRAPVIHVGGRLYPVEVEYLPPESLPGGKEDFDYVDASVYAVQRIRAGRAPGDILVFMPTEQDILETCSRLAGKAGRGAAVLPLYARLPASEQGRVYSVTGPKIVVATNVAETSLTIPGIKYVVDTGLARIAQYQPGSRISSLPISPISRSSADQRKGRCGRVQAGVCLRLYSEKDYLARAEYTPPEIVRSNLAEVILRMVELELGPPGDFPFVDPPHPRAVKDGYETLLELGAISGRAREYCLTPLGWRMAPMPLDPRISRMLLEASGQDCLREVAVVAAALSIRDPRERPPDKAVLADASQAVFRDPDSDFLTLLNIWDAFHGESRGGAGKGAQRKFCRDHFLSYARMREWGFVHDQILSILDDLRIPLGRRSGVPLSKELYAAVHRSVLSGFLSNIAVKQDKGGYLAAKNREVSIFPGSTLFGKNAVWIVSAEVVRTARLYARTAARIDPAWLEDLGGELCRRTYHEPRWDKDKGEVRALERVTLHGLEIVSGREVAYGPIDPAESHRIFIRSAMVGGHVKQPPAFLRHNLALRRKVEDMEEKLRRHDILVPEAAQADFYDKRLPGVYDLRGLDERVKKAGGDEYLRMRDFDLMLWTPDPKDLARFPDHLSVGERRLDLSYKFSPGSEDDGPTLKVPLELAPSLSPEALGWGLPGQFKDKVAALVKGLPKRSRKLLMPVADTVEIIVREMKPDEASLPRSLARFVKQRFHFDIPESEWARAETPLHLRMRVAVLGHHGEELAAGRDWESLQKSLKTPPRVEDSESFRKSKQKLEREGLRTWDFDRLPDEVSLGPFQTVYPALEPAAEGANVRLFKTKAEAAASQALGVEALLRLRFAKDLKFMEGYLHLPESLDRPALFFGGREALEKALRANLSRSVLRKDIRIREAFETCAAELVRTLFEKGEALRQAVTLVVEEAVRIRQALPSASSARRPALAGPAVWDVIRAEVDALVPKDFLERYPLDRVIQLPRLLRALAVRLERARNSPDKDRLKAEQVAPFVEALARLEKQAAKGVTAEKRAAVDDFRWMIEEFKVSLFAPEVGTAFAVSAKRLGARLKEVQALE